MSVPRTDQATITAYNDNGQSEDLLAPEDLERRWLQCQMDEAIESEIEMIRVYQVMMPDGIGPLRRGPWPNHWWSEFWRSLEYKQDQRTEFERLYNRYMSTDTLALVGCGQQKQSGSVPAKEKYTSTYFRKKRRWAELYADEWAILSSEHGVVSPRVKIDDYDTHIDDVDAETWAWQVEEQLEDEIRKAVADRPWECRNRVDLTEVDDACLEFVLLAGRDYVEPLADALGYFQREFSVESRWPFRETSGLPEQMRWLTDQIDAHPTLDDVTADTAIRIDRDWTETPRYIARHESGNLMDATRCDEGDYWLWTVRNDSTYHSHFERRLRECDCELISAVDCPPVEAEHLVWDEDQRSLHEFVSA